MNTVTPIHPHVSAAPAATGGARSIGDILVATGRLSVADAARISDRQQKDKSQFGD